MTRLKALGLALFALAVLPASAARATELVVSTALAQEGQLVSLVSGTYGEIFPGGSEAQADATVLALRRTLPDGQQLLEVVPATLDEDTEEDAELVVEPVSGVTYVFWQSWTNLIHSRLLITAFDGESWSEPIQVSGSVFAWRTSPAFAVTRDSFAEVSEPGKGQVTRTVLHILWSEEGNEGRWETLYAPLVLEDGQYIGTHPVLVLNDLVQGNEGTGSDRRIAPVLRSRDGENSVVAAFADESTGRIATVELRFAAGELSILGDAVAETIHQARAEKLGVDAVATAARARIQTFSGELKAAILDPLSLEIEAYLRTRDAATGAPSLADDARQRLLETGFSLTDGNVRRVVGVARPHLIDFGARSERPRTSRRHDARASVAVNRPLPAELPTAPEILVSSKGTKLVLAWREKDRVRYQESKADGGWSAVQQLQLGDKLDYAEAMDVLQRRIEQQ